MSGTGGDWQSSKGIAKAILHDRALRRRWLARWLFLTISWMAAGLWVIDGWLADDAWKFIAWWGISFTLAFLLAVFALYDALAVIREEREKSDTRLERTLRDTNNTRDE